MIKPTEKSNFDKLAKECITDEQNVNFFDRHQAAFFPDTADQNFSLNKNVPSDIDVLFTYTQILKEYLKTNWTNYGN